MERIDSITRRGRSRRFAPGLAAALSLAALALGGGPAQGTTWVELVSLDELVARAERAALVRVAGVRYGRDERRLHATWVALEVVRPLFGDVPAAGESFEIKIYGAPVAMPDGSRLYVDGTPRYRPGAEMLLLLRGTSPWGFTNTSGLMQGAFRVVERDGRRFAESLGGQRPLLEGGGLGRWLDASGVPASERRWLTVEDGPVPYDLLERAVVDLARAHGREVHR